MPTVLGPTVSVFSTALSVVPQGPEEHEDAQVNVVHEWQNAELAGRPVPGQGGDPFRGVIHMSSQAPVARCQQF